MNDMNREMRRMAEREERLAKKADRALPPNRSIWQTQLGRISGGFGDRSDNYAPPMDRSC